MHHGVAAAAAALVLASVAPLYAQARPSSLDAHSINPDSEYLVADEAFQGGYLNLTLARMVRPATRATSNEAEFMGLGGARGGQTFRSAHFWRTRQARQDDLRIGRLAFCLDAQTNNVYRAPQTRAEATQTNWFAAAVVDLSDLADGEVLIDTYRAAVSCLRVADDGPGDLPAPAAPSLDGQFVDTTEYFVRAEAYEGGYGGEVVLARMLRAPTTASGGEAEFVALQSAGGQRSGARFWTRHFWRTRVATRQDLRDGVTVIALDAQHNGVYRAPADRYEAVTMHWWIGAITDLANMFRGELQVGDYRVKPDALRVIVTN